MGYVREQSSQNLLGLSLTKKGLRSRLTESPAEQGWIEMKKQLKRLNNKEFEQDIKNYITKTHEFYNDKVPELKTLSKILKEEHSLGEFYKIFNRLWKSGIQRERILAIQTLELYKKDFDEGTWKFLKPKLKNIKSDYEVEKVRGIIKKILVRCPGLRGEVERSGFCEGLEC